MDTSIVHVFVFDTLADWEASYAISRINDPQFQKQPGKYSIRTVGLSTESIVTAGGMRIQPDMILKDLTPSDSAMFIIPGGVTWDTNPDSLSDVTKTAGEFVKSGVPIAAICGATSGLARAGLLDKCKHTSNAKEYLAFTGYKGSDFYQDVPAVTDDNVITASSIAALEFAYQILLKLNVFSIEALDAWYGLFKTGEAEYFYKLMQLAGQAAG
jgi:putative intracellular protease/amidase